MGAMENPTMEVSVTLHPKSKWFFKVSRGGKQKKGKPREERLGA